MKNGMKTLRDDNKRKVTEKRLNYLRKTSYCCSFSIYGYLFLIHQSVVPLIFEIFSIDDKVRLFFLPRYVPHIVRIPIIILFAILGIASLYKNFN